MVELKGNKGFDFILRDETPNVSETIGNISRDSEGFHIYFNGNVLKSVEQFLSSDISKELGGVLTGKAYKTSSGEKYIHIRDFIVATNTSASVSRLTFTHKTWEDINHKLETEHNDNIILGWFHSHPGHTVFMSEHDVFIQQNFFNMEFMVAYVFDPTIKERGFFYLENGEVKKATGFYVSSVEVRAGNDFEDYVRKDNSAENNFSMKEIKNKTTGTKDILLLLLGLLNIILVIYAIVRIDSISNDTASVHDVKTLNDEVEKLKSDYDRLSQRLESFIIESSLAKDTVVTEVGEQSP